MPTTARNPDLFLLSLGTEFCPPRGPAPARSHILQGPVLYVFNLFPCIQQLNTYVFNPKMVYRQHGPCIQNLFAIANAAREVPSQWWMEPRTVVKSEKGNHGVGGRPTPPGFVGLGAVTEHSTTTRMTTFTATGGCPSKQARWLTLATMPSTTKSASPTPQAHDNIGHFSDLVWTSQASSLQSWMRDPASTTRLTTMTCGPDVLFTLAPAATVTIPNPIAATLSSSLQLVSKEVKNLVGNPTKTTTANNNNTDISAVHKSH
jgi:hypothetical protein